jgi:hypothetical protein
MSDERLLGRAEEIIQERMLSGAEFTFPGLVESYGDRHYRLIDKMIQRLGRAGKIAYRRDGKKFIWRSTNGGSNG